LRVFENKVLRTIFGGCKNYILRNFITSSVWQTLRVVKSRKMRWVRHVACMEIKTTYRNLAGKLEAKRPLVRPKHRWENNIKMYLQETEHEVPGIDYFWHSN